MHIVIRETVLLLDLEQVRIGEFFHVLGNRRLRVPELFNKIFVADGGALFILLHDEAEYLDPRRVRQRI